MAKPMMRDNFGQFQKYATVHISKQLEKIAKEIEINVSKVVADKLEETYKTNVELSYGPRSQRGREVEAYNKEKKALEEKDRKAGIKSPRRSRKKQTYKHTGIFLKSIYTEIENNVVKVKIRDDIYPDGGASTTQVYKWLTEGTRGGEKPYPYIAHQGNDPTDPDSYSTGWARNYPTPAHLFEEHTKLQMESFLNSLENDIKSR